eukprot:4312679-Alexandrium_andersonii.AAC.1
MAFAYPSDEELARLLRRAGSGQIAIDAAKKLNRQVCSRRQRPEHQPPVAIPQGAGDECVPGKNAGVDACYIFVANRQRHLAL